jgi:hypothetical protein
MIVERDRILERIVRGEVWGEEGDEPDGTPEGLVCDEPIRSD